LVVDRSSEARVGGEGIEGAREAVEAAAWPDAYERFRAADPAELTAQDLEGLADAAWWLSKLDESLDLRHKAYAAYVAEGDERGAASVAARLSIEHFQRDEASVGAGFLMRAQRHAEGLATETEAGYLAMLEAVIARFGGDLDRALELSRRAIELGRRHGEADLVAMSVHVEGQVLIASGRVHEGIGLLDEAMAAVVGGGLSPYFTGIIYCAVISTCLELGDVRRAGEWSEAALAWCDTLTPGAPFPAWCRVNRAEIARLRGSWAEAESEALRAADELAALRPDLAAAAFIQLGETKRREGDLAGAEAAFERAQELGEEPQPGLALVRLAQGKPDAARTALRAALSGASDPPVRARLLAAQVEAALAADDVDEARAAAAELEAIASAVDLPAFAAAAATAEGSVALAGGEAPRALNVLRRAVARWQDLRLPYETASARAVLGWALLAGGDEESGRRELRGALAAFERLGAAGDANEVRATLEGPQALPAGLTAREAEVLRLVAAGKTNRDIAVELVISEHTVARHLQNMFAKLGVSSRAAATAFAFEHGLR
jgi:ATP/maltotriose-dependent transcriptional regulator MalT